MSAITKERILTLLDYERASGKLFWRETRGRRKAGEEAGSVHKLYRYRAIGLDGRRYRIHHLVWFLETGEWPVLIDHINHDPLDNRIANLRACTDSENICNRRKPSTNTSGFKGVFWDTQAKSWRAAIEKSGKKYHLGLFATREEGATAYDLAAPKYHGEFACLNGAV